MELATASPFPSLCYDVRVPNGNEMHVVVARTTFSLVRRAAGAPIERTPSGASITHALVAAPAQPPLAVKDEYAGEVNRSSVRWESDLAMFKPRCDVVVLGAAHSPTGEPEARVEVRVRISRAPENEDEAKAAKDGELTVLDRALVVHGERRFEKKGAKWALTEPEPFVRAPIDYEGAFGGELRVGEDEPGAREIPAEHRLPDDVRRKHPDGEKAPVAHTLCDRNPLGRGFLEGWYARAAGVEAWPAPRVEKPGAEITAEDFEKLVAGELCPGDAPSLAPQGLGVIAKPWQPRLRLAGTFDDRWLAERWPHMPLDFDMAYWNGAHPEMQCEHLFSGEWIELVNLLPPLRGEDGRPVKGDSVCRFRLPEMSMMLDLQFVAGPRGRASMVIDTVLVDLDEGRVSLVWRCPIAARPSVERAVFHSRDGLSPPPPPPGEVTAQGKES